MARVAKHGIEKMALKFKINKEKALESIVLIASEWENVKSLSLSKCLFFAEKDHMNKYGRPIIGDTYLAMLYGPHSSTVRDYITEDYLLSDHAEEIAAAIKVTRTKKYIKIQAKRAPRMEVFSNSDLECIRAAIKKCEHTDFDTLIKWTCKEKAWLNAPLNEPMNYEDFIDQDNLYWEAALEEAREFARVGVL